MQLGMLLMKHMMQLPRRVDMYIFLSVCVFVFFVLIGYLIGISL